MSPGTSSEKPTEGFLLHAETSIVVAKSSDAKVPRRLRAAGLSMSVSVVRIARFYCIETETERRSPAVTIMFATLLSRPLFSCT